MKKNWRLPVYGGFAVVLLLGFFYFVFRGTDNWKSKLPVIGYVEPFRFVSQLGDTVTQDQTNGKVYVANYFFVTCTGICPKMNGHVKEVYEQYKGTDGFMILSHTCQPEVDSVSMLKHYADSVGSDGKQWIFLTGNKLALYRAARESYHIDDPAHNVGDINDQFMHSQFLALVDRQGRVRGIYDGLRRKEVDALKTDIGQLLKETDRTGFVNNIFGNQPQ